MRAMDARSIWRIAIPAIAVGVIAAILIRYFDRGLVPGDAFTYLAAGERLNAGHPLYALSPGDRPVDLNPPYWTVPLLSPPPIAVVFRPLALLGDAGAYVWWICCIVALVATGVALLRRRPVIIGLAMLVLCIPIVYEIGVGNLNALIVAAITAAWYLLSRRRDTAAGALLALSTALKVTPAILAWWLVTQRRWTAVRAFVITGLAVLAVSVIGAGLDAHVEYLRIIAGTSSGRTSALSLAGMARFIGVPDDIATLLPIASLIIGVVLIAVLRNRPGLAWFVAVVTMLAGSPVVNVNWFTLLLAAMAPLAWPVADEHPISSAAPAEGIMATGTVG